MPRRVSPIETIRAQIDELFASGNELGTVLEEVGRLTVRLMMQTAIEAEVERLLRPGRAYPAASVQMPGGRLRVAERPLALPRRALAPHIRHAT